MSEELRNCPFCKTEDGETLGRVARNLYIAIVSPDEEFVVCNGCGATGPPKESEAAAAAAWNRRPSPEAGWVSVETDAPTENLLVQFTYPAAACVGFHVGKRYKGDDGEAWVSWECELCGSGGMDDSQVRSWRPVPAGPEGEAE